MKNGLIRRKRIVYIFGIVLPDDKKRRRGRYQKKRVFGFVRYLKNVRNQGVHSNLLSMELEIYQYYRS